MDLIRFILNLSLNLGAVLNGNEKEGKMITRDTLRSTCPAPGPLYDMAERALIGTGYAKLSVDNQYVTLTKEGKMAFNVDVSNN